VNLVDVLVITARILSINATGPIVAYSLNLARVHRPRKRRILQNTSMPQVSHIHVRPLEIGDFEFVRNLASKQPTFTVPPVYVLWLILRIKGAVCIIAEHSQDGPLAYLLAVPVEGPGNSIFIWQLAATEGRQRTKATISLLTALRETMICRNIDNVLFSSIPNSAVHRLIRRYARDLGPLVPRVLSTLPRSVDSKESEFLLNLAGIEPHAE